MTSEISADIFLSIDAFKKFSQECLRDIAAFCALRDYKKSDIIISGQEPSQSVCFILSGSVEVTIFTQSGFKISQQVLGPGELFGELSAIDPIPRPSHIVALKDTSLAMVPNQVFIGLMTTHPEVAQAAMQKMAYSIRFLSDNVHNAGALNLSSRIRAELVQLATHHPVTEGTQVTIDDMPTYDELANVMGTSAEAIAKEFAVLEKAGLIQQRQGRKLTIPNLTKLSSIL